MTIKRMDNMLIVVDDLEAVKAFFIDLGLEPVGQTTGSRTSAGRRASWSGLPSSWGSALGGWLACGPDHHVSDQAEK